MGKLPFLVIITIIDNSLSSNNLRNFVCTKFSIGVIRGKLVGQKEAFMGYCVHLSGQKFRIPANKIESCLGGMLNTDNKWLQSAVKDAKKHIKYFDHIPPLLKLIELASNIWGFKFTPSTDGEIDKISFELEKRGDFDGFCNAVAAHVESGSYLEFTGEDSERWRYVFRDGSWKNVKPVVTWPE